MAAVTVAATDKQRDLIERLRWATEPIDLGRVREQRKALQHQRRAMRAKQLGRLPPPRNGLAAIVGKWPGDETDEEIAQALKEI